MLGYSEPFLRNLCHSRSGWIRLNAFAIQSPICGVQQMRSWGYAPSFSAQVRLGEGHPSHSFGLCYDTDSCGIEFVSGVLTQTVKSVPFIEIWGFFMPGASVP
jgi:hypothetical protein